MGYHNDPRARLVVDVGDGGSLEHPLPDDPDGVCLVIERLALVVPSTATWSVIPRTAQGA